jgi:ABC-2 type transport system ATP-binding protein
MQSSESPLTVLEAPPSRDSREASLSADGDLAQLAFLLGQEVQGVAHSRQVENTVVLHARQARGLLPQLLNAADRGGFGVRDVSVSEPTLENVFIHLTGKDLRD